MIDHLVRLFLDFFGQIWAHETLRQILGSILVIFEIRHFLVIPVLFTKWVVSENQSILDKGAIDSLLLV